MAEPLSIAASSFAVLGLADVILRTGKELYTIIGAIKNAPTEVEELKSNIALVNLLVEEVNSYREELENSFRASGSVNSASPSTSTPPGHLLSITLRSLDRQLSALVKLAKQHDGFAKPWGKLKWVLDEKTITKYMLKLEASKTSLTSVLALVGRRRDISLPRIIKDDMSQEVENLKSTIIDQLHKQGRCIDGITAAVSTGRGGSDSGTLRVQNEVADMRRMILTASSQEHERSRVQIVRGNKEVIDALRYEIGSLPAKLAQVRLEAPKSGREIRLFGYSQAAVLTPLLLMRGSMHWAISHLLSNHRGLASEERLQWLMSEFEGLLASASQEAAATFKGSTATAFDEWIYGKNLFPSKDDSSITATGLESKHNSSKNLKNKRKMTAEESPRKRQKKNSQIFSFRSCIGKLEIYIRSTNPIDGTARLAESWEVGFSFSPMPDACSTWLTAQFKSITNLEMKPQLYTQLIALKIVPYDDGRLRLYLKGSIPDIDAAFRKGSISPYEICPEGEVWCYRYAGHFLRGDLLDYLQCHGLRPFSIDGGRGVLSGVLGAIHSLSDDILEPSTKQNLEYHLQDAASMDLELLEQPLLHCICSRRGNWFEQELVNRLSWWMSLLKAWNYDFDQVNNGYTPLASHAIYDGAQTVETIRLLLAFGANIQAAGAFGENALHCAVMSSIDESFPDVLERKFRILIEAGCNVNHCATTGFTPSDYALEMECWDEWCMALESNGLEILEVVLEDIRPRPRFGHTNRNHPKKCIPANSDTSIECLICQELDGSASNDGGSDESESDDGGSENGVLDIGGSDDLGADEIGLCQTNDSNSHLCISCRKVRASKHWLKKKAALISCYHQILESIVLHDYSSNGQYKPLLDFLTDDSIELLPNDQNYGQISHNIEVVQACHSDLFDIPEFFSPKWSVTLTGRTITGDRALASSVDILIMRLCRMKRAYLSDKARHDPTFDIIDAYADSPK